MFMAVSSPGTARMKAWVTLSSANWTSNRLTPSWLTVSRRMSSWWSG